MTRPPPVSLPEDLQDAVAAIGMAGRFPGARDVRAFWRNLVDGRETISRFSPDDLEPAGPDEMADRASPLYVPARGIIDDAEMFDAAFFAITPNEAAVMDPQQRVFLETAWEALEDAGHYPAAFDGPIGVFAGASNNTYFRTNLVHRSDVIDTVGALTAMMGNEKDYLATRTAYRLNLKGPALNIVTACSTSLVALSAAVQSLATFQSDMALAGGVSIMLPQRRGYLWSEGGITSPDGYCRAFDRDAAGTVFSNGLGIVVLRRLEDALADGDTVYAVIRSAALNNDGSAKVSFTAPSVEGHAEVISLAHALAGVDPATISYVEAHGTGTALGDPIEIAGLAEAFRAGGVEGPGRCALGSVKTNIGHLDAAAGIAGLIKTVLALHHETLPATLHFGAANPKLGLDQTPFFINDSTRPWPRGAAPRRAGVSSFGVGGTNAHVILEEAPSTPPSGPARPAHLIPLSARTPAALDEQRRRLHAHLAATPGLDLADVAFTLQTGRRAFSERWATAVTDRDDALAKLAPSRPPAAARPTRPPPAAGNPPALVFLLPGQGAQATGMAHALYEHAPAFAREIDEATEILRPLIDADLRQLLFPKPGAEAAAAERLDQTAITQPALFAVEYALARLLISWGGAPHTALGHSLGEYVAATLAGTFERDRALDLVARRAALMQALPPGAMLAVRASAVRVLTLLEADVTIAAYNAPNSIVVAGSSAAIDAFAEKLAGEGIACARLRTSHAFHSPAMDAILSPLEDLVRSARPKPPEWAWYSCLTGHLVSAEEATDPAYWSRQMRHAVRFSDALADIAATPGTLLVEVGPGRALAAFARQHATGEGRREVVTMLPEPALAGGPGLAQTLAAVGELWTAGAAIDWRAVTAEAPRRRVSLPTYPFERVRHWVDPGLPATVSPPAPAAITPAQPTLARNTDPGPTAFVPAPPACHGTEAMNALHPLPVPAPDDGALRASLRAMFADVSGFASDHFEDDLAFVELGLDSLVLTQAVGALRKRFAVDVKLSDLMGDLETIAALAAHLAVTAAPEHLPATPAPSAPRAAQNPAIEATLPSVPPLPSDAGLTDILAQHLALMSRQLDLLQHAVRTIGPAAPPAPAPAPPPAGARPPAPTPESAGAPAASRVHGVFRPPERQPASAGTTPELEAALHDFIARYTAKTARSKELTARHRRHLADPRSVAGFRRAWKEIVYPIVVERSEAGRVFDVDGNEHVDLVNGFGSNFFGHNAPFIREALERQLARGMEIGPQSPRAGDVAERFCRMVGAERAAYCNTGSEALVAAIRSARTVSGRDKIVMFEGAYHGIFDEVLVRPANRDGVAGALPLAPGIPTDATANVIVLDYGDPAALDIIAARGHEIAAVLVEPVQSRRPELRPKAFLQKLRGITAKAGTALVFDEVVTGFRVHTGGMQAVFGIEADIATYGKVVGGGLPIGVIAGRAHYLDALDGGQWSYGDASVPEVGVTFFAGTFVRHPLALAAADAVLASFETDGGAQQQHLNLRTTAFVGRLEAIAREARVPLAIAHFSSWFMVELPRTAPYASLFYAFMRHNGVQIWEGRPAFLTLGHTDADLDHIAAAFTRTLEEMRDAGFLPATETAPRCPAHASVVTQPAIPPGSSLTGTGPANTCSPQPTKGADDMTSTPRPVDSDPFADQRTILPLTPQQREIWVEAQMGEEANAALNGCFVLTLDGTIDPPALERALATVMARHPALRARFSEDGAGQVVEPAVSVPLTLCDHRALPDAERPEALAARVRRETATPFDLARPPLLRASLVTETDALHHLIVSAHHIVLDGFSSATFFSDLCEAYKAARFGLAPDLAPAADYAAAVHAQRDLCAARTHLAYWQALYSTPITALDLPTDRPRPDLPARTSARATLDIGPDLLSALKQTAQAHKATLFQTLLAAFSALLARLASRDELVVAIPTARQPHLPDAAVVGHFVSLLPLRMSLEGKAAFRDHLAATRETLSAAQSHSAVSMSDLLATVAVEGGNGIGSFVPVTFNIDRLGAPFNFAGANLVAIDTPKAASSFEHVVNVLDTGTSMTVQWDYWSDLYEPDTIRRWLGHFETLLCEVVRDPSQAVDAIDLLDAAERQRMLVAWNRPETPLPGPVPFLEAIDAQVRARADQTALIATDATLTYAELDARVNRLANHLIERGVGKGDFVGILLERTAHVPISFLAALKAGAAYVPIDPEYPEERIAVMVAGAGIRLVVTQRDFASLVPDCAATLEVDDEAEAARIAAQPATRPPVTISGDDLAHVHYTSGSTGEPKGIPVTHTNLANVLYSMSEAPGVTARDVVAAVAPVTFDPISQEIYIPLMVGARVVFADTDALRDGRALAELLDETGATLMQATPTRWRMLIDDGWQGSPGFKAQTGGEALTRAFANEILDRVGELWNIYGLTETTLWSTAAEVLPGSEAPTIGRPMANTQVYIVNRAGLPQPVGIPGELLIGGLGVGTGYLNRPELTAERFVPDHFRPETGRRLYRTGDLAKWLPDGRLVHLGRMDHQVKVNGVRIELGEVEAALRAHEAVKTCAVIARELQPGDNRLLAYVIVEPGADLTVSDFRRFLRKRLPDAMLPSFFVTIDALPLTPSGKLDRKALPDPFETEAFEDGDAEPPATGTETRLAAIWQDILRLPAVGANDNFFEIGGNSLTALAVVRRFEQETGWRMDPRTLFFQSLRQIAGRADEILATRDMPAAAP